jgi:uncharacterized protein YegP (UPF0339 family)
MSSERDDSLTGFYERTIGTPHDTGEVYGYLVFALGLVLGVVGILAFLASDAGGALRQWSIVAAALGLAALVAGPVIRLPLAPASTYAAYVGVALCAAATAWFVVLFPAEWSPTDGNPGVIALYALGLAIVGLGGVVVPVFSSSTTGSGDAAGSDEAAGEVDEHRAAANEAAARADDAEERAGELEAERDSLSGELADVRDSSAQFELYEDRGGEWRWRLRHRNGNVIATGGEGYTRRRDARRALDSVRERVPDADFDVYEGNAGEYRWRLRAENGEIVADSGEGYSSRSNAENSVDRVREYLPDADALDVGGAAFEVYEDAGGEWRWRLRHRNGNIVATGGEGYSSRTAAQDGVDSVKRNAPGADATVA